MTLNPATQSVFSDLRSPARGGTTRWKSGAGPAVLPLPAASSTPKVSLKDISLTYKGNNGSRLLALDSINLQVKTGEFLCIVGPSGCGKSTLLHLIAGLQQPSHGHVLVDDKLVDGPGTDRILIFQELGLFPWLTVAQNVEFGMKMNHVPKSERQEKIRYYLRLVHLSQFQNNYIHQLSGGMRQRVALARALATEPDVLLMDEPFAALDAQTREMMQLELLKIWSQTRKTALFITHDIKEAIYLSDRVIVFTRRPGRVKNVVEIKLSRPRDLRVKRDPQFLTYEDEIWESIQEELAVPAERLIAGMPAA